MSATATLGFDLIDSSQAQHEVTANIALTALDAGLGEFSKAMSDADYTLSTTSAPPEWNYGTIKLTGALTAGRNVICPTNKKLYVVVNGTTGGHAVTLKTLSGTGVSVDAGDAVLVRCDGTNVVPVAVAGVSGTQPYVVGGSWNGKPGASEIILRHKFVTDVTFPSGLTASAAEAETAATAQTDFTIYKRASGSDVSKGTMRWAASGTAASFIFSTETTFEAGSSMKIVAPSSQDATLSDLEFSLLGSR